MFKRGTTPPTASTNALPTALPSTIAPDATMSKNKTDAEDKSKSCGVCTENYTKYRKNVTCSKCNYDCCSQCVQTYILTKVGDPSCMNCQIGWSRDFLYTNLSKNFMNTALKTHRRDALFDLEKSRFPDSMNDISNFNNMHSKLSENRKNQTISNNQITAIESQLSEVTTPYNCKIKELEKEIIRLKKDKNVARRPILNKLDQMKNTQNTMLIEEDRTTRQIMGYKMGTFSGDSKSEKRVFIHPCSVEGCRGFLSTSWKCGVCDIYSCKTCFETMGKNKNVNHTCKKENVESAELIKKETKPCPKCGSRIYKISGCDQMWCTECHVTFGWKSGKIQTGIVHNPHFYQFQRNGGNVAPRNPGDQVCGGLPDVAHMESIFKGIMRNHKIISARNDDFALSMRADIKNIESLFNICRRLHRGTGHNIYTILDPLRRKIQNETDNRDLRFNYLRNTIDEKQFKRMISMRDTKRYKNQTLLNVVELFNTVSIEMLQDISIIEIETDTACTATSTLVDALHLVVISKLLKLFQTIEELVKYTNIEFEKSSKLMNVSTYKINDIYMLEKYKW
tara:strand:+ start:2800 stop:4494 length:1695 start_codon:yes stop_codon:yes gene_type:complete